MITHYISYSIAITFISWIVGMMIGSLLKKTDYFNKLSNMNFIPNETINNRIGLGVMKWIVTHTFFKFFNPMKMKKKIEIIDLYHLQKEMTTAELNHLIAFVFVLIFALIKLINGEVLFSFIFIIVNIIMNLYPSLLQQQNKRRIHRLITVFSRKSLK
nr:hypothetical protein [uncultured Carboxylicivirga sp.]